MGLQRAIAAAAILVCVACSGREAPPPAEPLATADVSVSWPLELALSQSVDELSLLAFGERWLGLTDGVGWRPPGETPSGLNPSIAERWRYEDRRAVEILARLDQRVMCLLGSEQGSFGVEVPEGWAVAAQACRAIDADEAARYSDRLRKEAGADVVELPPPPNGDTVASLLEPAVDRRVELSGETLRYRFVLPVQWSRATALLPVELAPTGLAARVGTSRWDEQGSLPGAAAVLEGRDEPGRRLARLERDAEVQVGRWRATLEQHPGAASLDAADRALLMGWVRRALYRDLGLAELEADRPAVAVALLEEATGSVARPEPGPGLDPLLLSAFASARLGSGEVQGAAQLLTRMASQPGWYWVGALAEGVARVAVLPSMTASEVRR